MDVFVSYAHVDRAVVDPVVAALDRHGIPYWFDRRDIPVSFPWRTEIRNAIRTAAVVVVDRRMARLAVLQGRTRDRCRAPQTRGPHRRARHSPRRGRRDRRARALGVDPHPAGPRRPPGAQRELDRNGRDRSGLVGGDLLERLHLVERKDWPLPREAVDFLTASEARDRLRRRLRRAGTFVVLVALGVGWLMQKVNERGERATAGAGGGVDRGGAGPLPTFGVRTPACAWRPTRSGEGTTAHWRRPRSSRPSTFRYRRSRPSCRVAPSWSSPTRRRPFPRCATPPARSSIRAERRWPRSPWRRRFPGRRPMGDVTVRAANAGIAAVGTASGAVVVRGGARRGARRSNRTSITAP